jgi:glutaredoxin
MRSKAKVLKPDAPRFVFSAATLAVFTMGALFVTFSHAQQVYRIVGADGKVTFSDQPPPAAAGRAGAANLSTAGVGAASAGLPYELRQVAGKYPVTLYTGENCVPCGSGRSMLTSRGIPFTEKTITTSDDTQALQRLSGDTSLPFVTIGSQQIKGYSDSEWTQFLNAAGYPASSALPSSYRRPAATPLVAVVPATAPATAVPAESQIAPPTVSPTNPAGIKF